MALQIVVHTDLTDASVIAVRYARALADALGGTLQFLHVLHEPLSAGWTSEVSASALPEVQQAMEVEAEQWLDQVLSEADQERFDATLDLETGDVGEEILRYAKEKQADIVVLRASSAGGADASDTRAAEDVVARCGCSVFVVR